MSLKNRVADQMVMDSSVFSLKNPWIVSFLIPIFTFACGNFTMFIIIASLILCGFAYVFLTHSKVIHHEDKDKDSDQIDSNQEDNVEIKGCLDVGSPESCSESEIIDPFTCTTEEDSEFDVWEYSGEVSRISGGSDGTISDEESLIEIELFGGKYDRYNYKVYKDEEEPKISRRKMSPDSVLWWPEMSEEENMIEIDLSVGSIKCMS
ncbi:hypothetical protein Hanom_Chr03g00241231 [Helianthus anomalus]